VPERDVGKPDVTFEQLWKVDRHGIVQARDQIKPSSIAIPTSVDVNDLATDVEAWIDSRLVPLNYPS